MGQVEANSAQLIAGIKGAPTSSNNAMWDSVTGVSATTAAKSTTSGASASSGDGDGDGGDGGTVAAIVITLLLGGLMGGYTVAKAKGKVGVAKSVVCGVWRVVCGVWWGWHVVGGVWRVACGVWCVAGGV